MSLVPAAKVMRSRTFGRPAGTSTARSPAWSAVHDRPLACPQDRRRALFRQRRGLGFHPHNHLVAFMIPRGIRLNNPGNIEHGAPWEGLDRSEEHTSELQSLMRISYAVFCLKKKNDNL